MCKLKGEVVGCAPLGTAVTIDPNRIIFMASNGIVVWSGSDDVTKWEQRNAGTL